MGSLSVRDRAIVDVLDEHEVFTTAQLARLYFTRLDVAQRRLLRLTRLSVLDRFRWRLPLGSESWHYVLGPIGAALAAARRDEDPPSVIAVHRRTLRIARRPQLAHLVGLNGWFCDLVADARSHNGRLAQWWPERRCTEQFGTIVRPDAAATYVEGERRIDFFFEYDNGTETLARVAAKLARYRDLQTAGGPAVPVLIWCESAVRERHLAELIATQRVAGLASGVTVALGSAESTSMLGVDRLGACWLVPGEEHRRDLFALPVRDATRPLDHRVGEHPGSEDDDDTTSWEA